MLAAWQTAAQRMLTVPHSIGQTLADTLDELISSRRIEPQLAMRVMQNFDQNIAAVLGEKVKARLSFKVFLTRYTSTLPIVGSVLTILATSRATWTPTASATKSGPSSSKM